MRHVELKTLNYFAYIASHDLKYLGPVYPNWLMPKYMSNSYNPTFKNPGTRVEPNLMWNVQLKTLLFISRLFFTWFGVVGPTFHKLNQSKYTCKTGPTQVSERLDITVNPSLMWNVELKVFGLSLYMIRVLLLNYPELFPYPIAVEHV